MSLDGQRVFFDTRESLNAGDMDASVDVYERFAGATTLISNGVTGGNGAFTAFLFPNGLSDDGTRAFFDTRESLMSSDTDTSFDIYAADVAGYPRPLSASPRGRRSFPLTRSASPRTARMGHRWPPVVQPSGGGVRPGDHGHVGRERRQPELRRVRPLHGGGRARRSAGRLRREDHILAQGRALPADRRQLRRPRTPPGRPTTPASCAPRVDVRMTDRWNATAPGGGPDSATVQDVPRSESSRVPDRLARRGGSTCDVTTSVNAFIPGAREGQQAGDLGDGTDPGL